MYYSFFVWHVIKTAIIKHQHPDIHSSCRRRTSTQNTWQQTRYFNVDFDSNGLLFLVLYFREVPLFRKKQKHLLKKIFGSTHTSNRTYLLRNCFSNYVYLKDMYIILKGIRKIRGVFTKKNLSFPKFTYNFPGEKVNFGLIHPAYITIHSF